MRLALKKTARPTVLGPLAHWIGRRLDGSPYSHAELVFSSGVSASSVMGEGVRFKQIAYTSAGAWDFFTLPQDLEARAHRWFFEHEGSGYDYAAMARFWWGVIPEASGRWTCCEAIAAALGWSGAWRLGPGGLLARVGDTYGAHQVDGPWPVGDECILPALQRHLRRAAVPR